MLKRIIEITNEMINYCVNKQRSPENRSVPYMEDENEMEAL
jgi:hypothetical protein